VAKPYTDKKLKLGEPLASKLRDFCAANYDAPALNIIREAVDEHIEARLQNREMRERFESARRTRLGEAKKVVRLASKNGD
jgi:hypothetical protein